MNKSNKEYGYITNNEVKHRLYPENTYQKLEEDKDDYNLHSYAIECRYEGFDFAQEEFINENIKNLKDYINKVKSESEDYEEAKEYYLSLDDYNEDDILEELYKILTGEISEDFELNTYIEIIDDTEEAPYLSGGCEEDIDIGDRYDLSEDELWATGWHGIVQNITEKPFKSFNEMDICCFDDEKDEEYDLPKISEDIKKEFLEKVNKWIELTKENDPELLDN